MTGYNQHAHFSIFRCEFISQSSDLLLAASPSALIMPSYQTANYRLYDDRSMEMLGRSMMLATISEEQLAHNGYCCGSSSLQSLGFHRSSALSQTYKAGLAELVAQAQQQQHQGSVQQPPQQQQLLSAPEDNDDCWGFFMDDQ